MKTFRKFGDWNSPSLFPVELAITHDLRTALWFYCQLVKYQQKNWIAEKRR